MSINKDKAIDRAIQVAILLFAVMAYAFPLTSSPPPTADPTTTMSSVSELLGRYWPIGAIAILTIINLAITHNRPPRPKGPFLRGLLIIGNGAGHNVTQNTLNTAALLDFKKDYKVAIVCGLNDPTADKYEDTRISKSAAFTITGQELDVVIRHQPPMTDVLNAALAAHAEKLSPTIRRGFRGYGSKKKVLINYQINVWTEVILLPNGVDPASIRKLSDVRHLNGKIMTEEVQERRVTPTW